VPDFEHTVALDGTDYLPLEGAEPIGEVTNGDPIQITVAIRRCEALPELSSDPAWAQLLPHERPYVDLVRFGSDPDDIALVETFARKHGLEVIERSTPGCRLVLEGSPQAIGRAFNTELIQYDHPNGRHRGHTGAIHVPRELSDIVTGVFGLHDKPLAGIQPSFALTTAATRTILTPAELADLYDFPSSTGKGQRIGIIELGGGFRREDLAKFFAPGPVPKITEVPVGKGSNQPEKAADVAALMRWLSQFADGKPPPEPPPNTGKSTVEVTMDVELIGAFAPEAEIIVYFAENHDHGLVEALQAALDPNGLKPNVLSLSWSWNEKLEPVEAHVNERLLEAAHAGMTFCVASGDFGSRGFPTGLASAPGNTLHPQFPPTSPYALACGGTTLEFLKRELESEVAWNTPAAGMSSGGGVSTQYALPHWQEDCSVPEAPGRFRGRGIPDAAADADPSAHCRIFAGGEWGPAAGTSASAPLWAALIARLNESLGTSVGYLNPLLYRLAGSGRKITRDIQEGNNGTYQAKKGWDACTGLGSPRGTELLTALRGD
jgi:kumamolisin